MEVSQRLDVLQEQQMELCEQNSTDLKCHVQYWQLLRTENALLHAARQSGYKTLSSQVVPPLQTSKAQSKVAIEMHLMCQSLLESKYGKEPWTQAQTSKQMWDAEPKYTFKKGGQRILVRFDDEVGNEMEYVLWSAIYYLDLNDEWQKTSGYMTTQGLCYDCNGVPYTYVKFAEEAAKYAETGTWKVLTEDLCSNDCDSDEQNDSGFDSYNENDFATLYSTSCSGATESLPASPDIGGSNHTTLQDPSKTFSTTLTSSPALPTGSTQSKRPQRSLCENSKKTVVRRRRRQGKRPSTSSCDSDCTAKRNWGQVSEPGINLPVIFVRGSANIVKCLRYRLRKQWGGLYLCCSSTWAWVQTDGKTKHPWSKITIGFASEKQRSNFLNSVSFPTTVKLQMGTIPW